MLKLNLHSEGANQTQQARYLRITISQKLNVPTHCLQEGHPLNPERKEMREMAEIEPHNRYMQIRLTEAEYEAIERKFRNSGLRSRSEFIRAMIFEGYIVNFDEEKFDKIYRLVGNISNNINQIAVRANSTNKVYAEDIVNIKEGQDKIWQLLNSLQSKLLRLKR